MRLYSAVTCAVLALAVSTPALAGNYNFSFTPSQNLFGTSFSGSGVFTTSDTAMIVGGQTAYAITGITGMIDGSAIVAPSGGNYGNYFTTGAYFLDGSGVSITNAAGRSISFFNQSNNNLYRVNSFSPGASFYVTATTSAAGAVPEPASWAMMIAGFGLVGAVARRRTSHMLQAI